MYGRSWWATGALARVGLDELTLDAGTALRNAWAAHGASVHLGTRADPFASVAAKELENLDADAQCFEVCVIACASCRRSAPHASHTSQAAQACPFLLDPDSTVP
jgi:hypothetical protein